METKQTFKQMKKQSLKQKRAAFLLEVFTLFLVVFLCMYGLFLVAILLISELLKYLGIIPN